MIRLIEFIDGLLVLYSYVVIAAAVASWLVAFHVVNVRHQFTRSVLIFLDAVTEPLLRPIRYVLPNLGGIDISPVILLIAILAVRSVIIGNILEALGARGPTP